MLPVILLFVSMSCVSAQEVMTPVMVPIRGGSFPMGTSSPQDRVEKRAAPSHEVLLSDFYMAESLVSMRLWKAFLTETGYTGYTFSHRYYGAIDKNIAGDDSPALFLSWSEAVVFCNWLSARQGLEPAYVIEGRLDPATRGSIRALWRRGVSGYRLVTEAEWEYVMYEKGASRSELDRLYGAAFDARQPQPTPSVLSGQRTSTGVLAYPNFGISEWTWDEYLVYGPERLDDPLGKSGLSSDGTSKVHRYFNDYIYYNRLSTAMNGGGAFTCIRLAQDVPVAEAGTTP